MKSNFLLLMFVFFSFNSLANEERFSEQGLNQNEAARYIRNIAEQFGMSDLSMVKARENFFNYKNGIISPNHPAIFHLPEFKYPESYTESERQVVFNNFQSQFANFFGVPVNKLSLFLSSMEAEYEKHRKYAKFSRGAQLPSNWDDKLERITIKCSGNMCSWAGSGESLSLWTRIGGEALSRGIDNGEKFFVDYYHGDTLVTTESWRSYGASGAHFEREV